MAGSLGEGEEFIAEDEVVEKVTEYEVGVCERKQTEKFVVARKRRSCSLAGKDQISGVER